MHYAVLLRKNKHKYNKISIADQTGNRYLTYSKHIHLSCVYVPVQNNLQPEEGSPTPDPKASPRLSRASIFLTQILQVTKHKQNLLLHNKPVQCCGAPCTNSIQAQSVLEYHCVAIHEYYILNFSHAIDSNLR